MRRKYYIHFMCTYKSSNTFHRRRKYDGIISQVAKYEEYNSRVPLRRLDWTKKIGGKSWKIGLLPFFPNSHFNLFIRRIPSLKVLEHLVFSVLTNYFPRKFESFLHLEFSLSGRITTKIISFFQNFLVTHSAP